MALVTPSDNTDTQHTDIQFTLSWSDAQRLRTTLPWLMQALADRPTLAARQRERRQQTRSALESLLSALSGQSQETQDGREGETQQ
jgi:hypothetical protein